MMKHAGFERQTLSFVLRLWLETETSTDPAYSRGQLEVVTSGETIHFSDLSEILAILTERINRVRDEANK